MQPIEYSPRAKFAIVTACAGAIALVLLFTHLPAGKKSDREESILKFWLSLQDSDVVGIVVHPLAGDAMGQETVERALEVGDPPTVRRILAGLRSKNVPQHYLSGVEHWSSTAFVKVELKTGSGESLYFRVNWHAGRRVCEFALMRDGSVSRSTPRNAFRARADDSLAAVLNSIVAEEGIKWVERDDW